MSTAVGEAQGRGGTWGRRARGLMTVLWLLALPACLSERPLSSRLGFGEDRADDAVGFVSVSTPLFTPLDEGPSGSRRLDFGTLRSEEKLWQALGKPSFGIQEASYDMFRLAVAARIAGIAIDVSEEQTKALNGSELPDDAKNQRVEKRTFKTPTDVQDVKAPEIPDDIRSKLVAMLAPDPTQDSVLPPDQLATLVAGLKTYMVNLEDYYNVSGFDYRNGLTVRYVPYRVHFTVTAEPGWYSRYNKYDAVIELRLSMSPQGVCAEAYPVEADSCVPDPRRPESLCNRLDDDLIVLHVSPVETAQSVSEFASQLNEFAAAIDAEGPIDNTVFLRGQAQRLTAAARRLQGMRSHKTIAVGFPGKNCIRIRFLAERAAIASGRDLQAISRVLTATVLVPTSSGAVVPDLLDIAGSGTARPDAGRESAAGTLDAYIKLKRGLSTVELAREAMADGGAGDVEALVCQLEGWYAKNGAHLRNGLLIEALRQVAQVIRRGHSPDDFLEPLVRATLMYCNSNPDLVWSPPTGADGPVTASALQDALDRKIRSGAGSGDVLEPRSQSGRDDSGTRGADSADAFLNWLLAAEVKNGEPTQLEAKQFAEYVGWKLAHTMIGLKALSAAADNMRERSRQRRAQFDFDLRGPRESVRRMLCGTEALLDVRAWYAPTMFDATGAVAPPRDYALTIQPPDARLRAEGGGWRDCAADFARTVPIPPWLGPLADEPVLAVEGIYGARLASALEADAGQAVAEAGVAKATAAVTAAEKALQTARKDPNTCCCRIQELEQALADASGNLKTAKDTAKEKAGAATIARALALAHGSATVRLEYSVPRLLLDTAELLVVESDAYARVLGLPGEPQVGCERTTGPQSRPGLGCRAGEFVRLPTDDNEAVLHVTDVDLTLALGTTKVLADLKPLPMDVYVELVVVPRGALPEDACSVRTARVVAKRASLTCQSLAGGGSSSSGAGASGSAAKSTTIQLEIKGVEVDLVPPALQK